jgi:hydrogenase nickel incorporation protein HypA/HybF
MHELSIAQALVEQLDGLAARERATRVTRVEIAVGALSGADPDALALAYPAAAEGTRAAGSELVIHRVAARIRCRDCGRETATGEPVPACACGSERIEWLAGRELDLLRAELLDESPA